VGRTASPVEETWGSEGEGDGAVGRIRRPRGEGACGVVTRGPGFLCFLLLLRVITVFTILLFLLSGGRGDEGAATEPAIRGGTADRKRMPP